MASKVTCGGGYLTVTSGNAYIQAPSPATKWPGEAAHIELVRDGFVRQYIVCSMSRAPDEVIRLMRNKFQPLSDYPLSQFEKERLRNLHQND